MSSRILDAITSPQDLHVLSNEELDILCAEIREEIINVTSANGGHVAPSLGAVELIVALHSLLDCPTDKLVFDVGHQAYAHKLLCGRRGQFSTLRTYGGITGFPNPAESAYDMHPSGHASDSLSVAMGLARARDLAGGSNKVVAVIGDASLAGGMAFEALNHIGQEQIPMMIVLNDNGMSISHPVGALVRHLGYLRADNRYRSTRDAMQQAMEESGPLSRGALAWGKSAKDSVKQFFLPHSMIFEQLNITCTAPVDGHDLATLREVFDVCLRMDGPVLVHVVTEKGHGYEPARINPERFHGVGPYDKVTGTVIKKPGPPTYTSVFGQALVAEAEADPRIVAITAAMKDGTGLAEYAKRFPKRFIDTGITEEHAVGLASGLAAGGAKPVVAIYSTFLQRSIDQIIIDCALANRNMIFALDRAGLVGDDGPTHHGVMDIAYLRMIPNLTLLCPSDEAELVGALHTALHTPGTCALRYPRGAGVGAQVPETPVTLPVWEVGQSHTVLSAQKPDVCILAFGRMVRNALGAAEVLERNGISVRVVDMRWAKPLDIEAIYAAASARLVVTIEEGTRIGGAGSGVLEVLADANLHPETLVLGLPDEFIPQGKIDELFAHVELDAQSIAARIQKHLDS